jgi:hypothetical protein
MKTKALATPLEEEEEEEDEEEEDFLHQTQSTQSQAREGQYLGGCK